MSNAVNVTETSNSVVVVESDNSVTVTQADNSVVVTSPASLPLAGATDDLLVKQSATDGDVAWQDTIKVDQLDFDTAAGETLTAAGQMAWDADVDTIDVLLRNGSSTPTLMHVGQDEYFYVKASSAITRGQVVHYTGTDGASGHILAAPFVADGTYESKTVIGVATQDADTGGFIHVLWRGKLRSFDTSLLTPGILYASTTVAGAFQSTAPTAPNNIVTVAVAVNSKNNGTILVRPTFAGSLAESEDVDVSSPSDGDVLTYSSSTGVWESSRDDLLAPATSSNNTNITIIPHVVVTGYANSGLPVNLCKMSPMFASRPITPTELRAHIVTAAAAGSVARFGIYQADENYQPTNLVVDYGEILIDTTGAKVITGLSTTLPVGRLLLAVLSNANVTFRTPVGSLIQGNFLNLANAQFYSDLDRSIAYQPFPATFTNWSPASTSIQPRYFATFRVAP